MEGDTWTYHIYLLNFQSFLTCLDFLLDILYKIFIDTNIFGYSIYNDICQGTAGQKGILMA